MFYLKIALRNLLKNYRRSAKTIMTVVIGLTACMLAQGFMSYTLMGLRESLINGGLGHIQVYQKGYLEHKDVEPYQYLIKDSSNAIGKLGNIPGIKLCAPGLNFQGMIASGARNSIFLGTAGLPENERLLNTLVTLKAGSYLKTENPYGVVIGSGLARKLKVEVGAPVTLMTAMNGGGINAVDLVVVGIIEVQVKAYNDRVLLANLEPIQNLTALPDAVDRITLLLSKTEDQEKIIPQLKKVCAGLGLEYADWRQLAGKQYNQPRSFYDLVYILVMTIVILVVILSIINTLNLTVQERVREIGTIRSLGTTRLQVGKIFLMESFFIGLSGVILGIIVGYGLAALFNLLGGVPIPPPPGQARGYTALFKPNFLKTLQLGLLFLFTTTLAGFYPAIKAARLRVVDALRWI